MNLERLRQKYPHKFAPSLMKAGLSYGCGGLLLAYGAFGLVVGIVALFQTDDPILLTLAPLLVAGVTAGLGVALLRSARGFLSPDTESAFVLECRQVEAEILTLGVARRGESESLRYERYDLEQLLDAYRHLDRERYPEQFSALALRVLEELG